MLSLFLLSPIAESVASLIGDTGVVSLIPVKPYTVMEIDHKKILQSFSSCCFKKGCCQLQAKVYALSMG